MTITDHEFEDIATPSGPMRTHLFRPAAKGKYPGLLLFSEIFQVTGPIRRTAAWFAGHGFLVAVPEIYHEFEAAGAALAYDSSGADRGNTLKITKELSAYDADARAGLASLTAHPSCTGRLGVIGICIGGHLAFRAAMNPQVSAGACFYATDIHKRGLGLGMSDDTLDRTPEIQGEMLMIWGRQDPHVPREGRRIVYDALANAGTHFQWHEFNAAHAFMRDEGPRYDPAVAQICQAMAIELFKRRLAEGDRTADSIAGSGEAKTLN